jgi:hypothetical protein
MMARRPFAPIGWLIVAAWFATIAVSCAPAVRSTLTGPPTSQQMAELWLEPPKIQDRDLFHGPGGRTLKPVDGSSFRLKKRDTSGTSPGYDVVDSKGVEWSVKLGKEAQTEVVASRILWAIGYHQPPTYYLAEWTLDGGGDDDPKGAARFRPELPGERVVGDWPWHENPFVGTQPFRGLILANMILNNWDMKASQNKIYEVERRSDGPARRYVVRDLGATLGKPRWPTGTKNNVEHFENHGFIRAFRNGRYAFDYYGRHPELFRDIAPEDMRWICSRLAQLTPEQWRDAFRAAAYEPHVADRYVRKIQDKIREGLSTAR